MTDLARLITDLRDEQNALDTAVADLPEHAWRLPTPSPGWEVRDQIHHLAYFDQAGTTALRDPERFVAERDTLLADPEDRMAAIVAAGRERSPTGLLSSWRAARADMLAAIADQPEGTRVPWYGPSQSLRSFATARLMETWAHGLDAIEALHAESLAAPLEPTDRLAHICHIGVATRAWSFIVRGEEPPEADVRVELTLPSGAPWTAGPETAENRVSGEALDFCQVVTQRRNVADTALQVEGAAAKRWMAIAQCFAGEPTVPPEPGTRARR